MALTPYENTKMWVTKHRAAQHVNPVMCTFFFKDDNEKQWLTRGLLQGAKWQDESEEKTLQTTAHSSQTLATHPMCCFLSDIVLSFSKIGSLTSVDNMLGSPVAVGRCWARWNQLWATMADIGTWMLPAGLGSWCLEPVFGTIILSQMTRRKLIVNHLIAYGV